MANDIPGCRCASCVKLNPNPVPPQVYRRINGIDFLKYPYNNPPQPTKPTYGPDIAQLSEGVQLIRNWHQASWDIPNIWYNYQQALKSRKAGGTTWYWPQSLFGFADVRAKVLECMTPLRGLILATTPTYISQYAGGCFLREAGFRLVSSSCYMNFNYSNAQAFQTYMGYDTHPGCPDGYGHWIHVWYKPVGPIKNLGVPHSQGTLNCCGCIYADGGNFLGSDGRVKDPTTETT